MSEEVLRFKKCQRGRHQQWHLSRLTKEDDEYPINNQLEIKRSEKVVVVKCAYFAANPIGVFLLTSMD